MQSEIMKKFSFPILKKILLFLIPLYVVIFSYIPATEGARAPSPGGPWAFSQFTVGLILLLLLWVVSFYLEGSYSFADIPILLLLFGTFAFGRTFSLIGIPVRNLPLFITEALLAASLGLILLKGKTIRKQWKEKQWNQLIPKDIAAAMIIYFALGMIYLAIGVWGNGSSALRDIVFCLYMLFFVVALHLFSEPQKIKKTMSVFLPGIFTLLIIVLAMYFVRLPGATFFKRFATETKMFNLSFYFGLMLMFLFSFYGAAQKKMKGIHFFILFVAFLFVILLEVRAGWLGLLLGLILLGILLKKEMLIIIPIIAAVVASLFIIDYFGLSIKKNKISTLTEQVRSIGSPTQRSTAGANIKWRLGIWEQTGQEILKHPVFGWGYGIQIDYIVWKKRLSFLRAKGANSGILPAHNHALAITHKMGIVGLLLFIYFNLRIFIYGLSYLPKCRSHLNRRFLIGSLAALVYWHGMALFFDVLESPPTSIFLWFILGAIVSVVHVERASGGPPGAPTRRAPRGPPRWTPDPHGFG